MSKKKTVSLALASVRGSKLMGSWATQELKYAALPDKRLNQKLGSQVDF
ncbi:MAG: hypothetical protein QNJ18_05830 [Xenococcaceae cyanobacterium MO_167.B52]|nr:hypothetical protein [Xenococcaceae cyanobacterium MO_167.B52]